jgi:uncharacterized membrane protein
MGEQEVDAGPNTPSDGTEAQQLPLPPADQAPSRTDPSIAINQLMVQLNAWQGSLPPPQLLAQYRDIIPNAPERLMSMVEAQANHRIDIEKGAVAHNRMQSGRSLICGTIVVIAALAVCCVLVLKGQSLTGFIGVLLVLAALVGALLGTRSSQSREAIERAKIMAEELTRVLRPPKQ